MTALPSTTSFTNASLSLYVGDLAPEVTEAILFDIFNPVGPVASIRVCREAMLKRSLGYAYVNFHNHQDAECALHTLNYTIISGRHFKGRPCRIMWSQRDPSLRKTGVGNVFVKNLGADIDHKQLQNKFSSLFGKVLSCKVALNSEGKSKGYGYVHFETEEGAKAAIDRMDEIEFEGRKVMVESFQKKEHPHRHTAWTNLFVKNIPTHLTEVHLLDMFKEFGPVSSLKLMTYNENDAHKDATSKKPHGVVSGASKGFGFVAFDHHEHALAAVAALNGKVLPDSTKAAQIKAENDASDGRIAPADDSQDEMPTKTLFVCCAEKKEERQRVLRGAFAAAKQERLQATLGMNLFVKNLAYSIDEMALNKAFKDGEFGTITSCRVMRHPDGTSRGFGFVSFSTPEEASNASNEMNGKVLKGRPIYVALAQRKKQRHMLLSQQYMVPLGGLWNTPQQRGPAVPMMYQGMGRIPNQGACAPMMMNGRGISQKQRMPFHFGYQAQQANQQQQRGQPMRRQHNQLQGQKRPSQQPGQPGPGRRQLRKPNLRQQQQPHVELNPQARNHSAMTSTPMPSITDLLAMSLAPLTTAALAAADTHTQKQMIGVRLYLLIIRSQPHLLAGKITGMLLEMDNSELLHLLESPESLHAKMNEALEVLRVHGLLASQG